MTAITDFGRARLPEARLAALRETAVSSACSRPIRADGSRVAAKRSFAAITPWYRHLGSFFTSASIVRVSMYDGMVGLKGLLPFRITQPAARPAATRGMAAIVNVPLG